MLHFWHFCPSSCFPKWVGTISTQYAYFIPRRNTALKVKSLYKYIEISISYSEIPSIFVKLSAKKSAGWWRPISFASYRSPGKPEASPKHRRTMSFPRWIVRENAILVLGISFPVATWKMRSFCNSSDRYWSGKAFLKDERATLNVISSSFKARAYGRF